ncbi:hypothetical protein HDV06_006569 [Boothiomyces sp. JEL0866]|nr:hypothetical protein HDV06_006569 [Boothiomyces sp. JEL0866]
MIILLLELVTAQLVIESQFKAQKCAGPPDTIYGFVVPDVTAYAGSSNYTWPTFWNFHSLQATVGSCGNLAVSIPGSCCIESLDFAASSPYNSGIPKLYEDKSSVNSVVTSSVDGTQYCYAEARDYNDYSALFGYRFVYLLPNGDNCIDNTFKCNNGVLKIYNGTGCQGSVDTITLSTTSSSHNGVAGSINAQLVTITQGNLVVSWVVDLPWKYVIAHWDGIGIVCAIFFFLGMIIGLSLFVKDLLHVVKTRDISTSKILALSAKLFWFLYVLFSFLYWAILFPSTEGVAQFSEVVSVSLAIASLLSVILWMFIFDTFVPIMVGLRIISLKNSKNFFESIPLLLRHHPKLIYWILGQVLGFIFYYVISYIKFNTYLCGNDLMYLNMSAFLTFCLILHGVFTDSIIEIIITLTKQSNSTPQKQKNLKNSEPNSPATNMELL